MKQTIADAAAIPLAAVAAAGTFGASKNGRKQGRCCRTRSISSGGDGGDRFVIPTTNVRSEPALLPPRRTRRTNHTLRPAQFGWLNKLLRTEVRRKQNLLLDRCYCFPSMAAATAAPYSTNAPTSTLAMHFVSK